MITRAACTQPMHHMQFCVVCRVLPTIHGVIGFDAEPVLYKTDLFKAYEQITPWPYCQALKECVVYRQKQQAHPTPITIYLPPNTTAFDFYLDLGIDCVTTLNVSATCVVQAYSSCTGDVGATIKGPVESICSSPKVGKYYGFYSDAAAERQDAGSELGATWQSAGGAAQLGQDIIEVAAARRLLDGSVNHMHIDTITKVTVRCEGSYPYIYGLLRLDAL